VKAGIKAVRNRITDKHRPTINFLTVLASADDVPYDIGQYINIKDPVK
jgi:hypothetical protein